MTFTGHIISGQIVPDEPHTLPEGAAVVICPIGDDDGTSTIDAVGAVEESGVLDFWKDDAEDVYTARDGEPV